MEGVAVAAVEAGGQGPQRETTDPHPLLSGQRRRARPRQTRRRSGRAPSHRLHACHCLRLDRPGCSRAGRCWPVNRFVPATRQRPDEQPVPGLPTMNAREPIELAHRVPWLAPAPLRASSANTPRPTPTASLEDVPRHQNLVQRGDLLPTFAPRNCRHEKAGSLLLRSWRFVTWSRDGRVNHC